MFHMTVTVNLKDSEKDLPSQRYSSEWAMLDHIQQILREQKDATSFVFVVARKD
jgi:hypothetical protein